MRRMIGLAVAIAALAFDAHAQEALLSIADEVRIEPGEQEILRFDLTGDLLAQQPALRLLARLDREALGGSTYAMRIWLNETRIDVERMLNKPPETRMYSGQILPWEGQSSFRAVYSPDWEAANRSDNRNCLVGGKAYEFVFAVADLLGEGANTLRIRHMSPNIPQALVVAEIALVVAPEAIPAEEGEIGAPAPTGELPLIAPKPVAPVEYSVEPLDRGGFAIVAGDQRVTCAAPSRGRTSAGTAWTTRRATRRRPGR